MVTLKLTNAELRALEGMAANSTMACNDEETGSIIGSRKAADIRAAFTAYYKLRDARRSIGW